MIGSNWFDGFIMFEYVHFCVTITQSSKQSFNKSIKLIDLSAKFKSFNTCKASGNYFQHDTVRENWIR